MNRMTSYRHFTRLIRENSHGKDRSKAKKRPQIKASSRKSPENGKATH
jgi:hypothetical protein